ncbi:MAG TPA: sodium:alanine symporter family protein [Kiloniellales bacterium]|jgi:AGCS family alanine or glycine:cation symporter|nr:sodium:alanine symporter family protein [Kiloniellales bacterium]
MATGLMDLILAGNDWLNNLVWGPPFMILLVGTGLFLTIRLGFFQFTHLRFAWRRSFGLAFRRGTDTEGAISPLQAVASAMAATVGVGNIAGVATALALGGPGAIFWMWAVALVGMATKFAEAALGVKYRQVLPSGQVLGGAFYYIERGVGWKWLAVLYAVFAGFASLGIGNMVQANTMAHALETGFGISSFLTGGVAMVLVGIVTLGGITRIAVTAERIVPAMAIFYILASLTLLAVNFAAVPAAFASIFHHAFTPAAPAGGFAGAGVLMAVRYGVARGIFSNEAGLGSASIAHAQARNSPGGQGLWGMWEVAIDTLVIGTMTALVILVSGALEEGVTGAELATQAFSSGLPGIGGLIVLVALVLFSYTTMLTWGFYGEQSFHYLFGRSSTLPYRVIFLLFIFIGAVGGLEVVWDLADTLNGLMAAPNLIALIVLSGVVARERTAVLSEAAKEKLTKMSAKDRAS